MNAADVLAKRLYDEGVRHAFGIPGGEVLTLVKALEDAGVAFVLCKHENAAGFMAEAAYHRTGAPGVLVATLGPGAMNGVNSIANAWQDRVPLIVLTGCVDADEAASYTHQVMDHSAVFAPITKGVFTLTAASADIIADKAVSLAVAPRPGPVHIDVPISVAAATANDHGRRQPAPAPVVPTERVLAELRARLDTAQRPIAIVGLDGMVENSSADIQAFLEARHIPFVTTYKAKGLVPEDHPLCLGGAGLSPKADALMVPVVQQADLILGIGYDPIEMRPGWRDIWDPDRCVDIVAAPNDHHMHRAGLQIVAHVGATCAALTGTASAGWADGQIDQLKADLATAFPLDTDWGPAGVIAAAMEALPRDTIASVDSGAHRILLSQMWQTSQPRGLMQSTGLCTMGCAIPLAMGAAMLEPDRVVVAFTGDAGALMVLGEISTAAEMGLKLIIVVFVDASLALIEKKQRERQLPNAGVDFGHHDFAAIARAFGGAGVTVRDRAALVDALTKAQSADTFTLIAAEIPPHGYDGLI